MSPEAGGACYGGFTHKDLWHPTPDSTGTTIKFNVSMWRPYKVLLVETELSE